MALTEQEKVEQWVEYAKVEKNTIRREISSLAERTNLLKPNSVSRKQLLTIQIEKMKRLLELTDTMRKAKVLLADYYPKQQKQ